VIKFIHTSDLQIGKTFRFADEETLAILRSERIEVIGRIGVAARTHGATAVLVAGDIFDVEQVSLDTLLKPIERMRQFGEIQWHLIPGNHDAHTANGPWDRLSRLDIPSNVTIHLTDEAKPLNDESAWVIPAILTNRHMSEDPTLAMGGIETPVGSVRIGLAHGSVRTFGSSPSSTNNVLAFDRAKLAKLDFLALGDWHGTNRIDERTWYSGTPEGDGFDPGGDGSGQILLIELPDPSRGEPAQPPKVSKLGVGRFRWIKESASINSADDVDLLEGRLRGLDTDLSRVLLQLNVSGTLDLRSRELFEKKIRLGLGSALRALRLNAEHLHLKPTAADLEAIDHMGFVREAANELASLAADEGNAESTLASEALQRLYVMHLQQEAGA
jgi:DNA repair exonuclease SbcCD nuclease subunit